MWRGMKLRCPSCGGGKLFRSYLKPVDHCSNCNQRWEHVRADLAPAWAAMTLAAHYLFDKFANDERPVHGNRLVQRNPR